MPTDSNAETLPKALRLQLLSRISEMRHNTYKRTKAAQQQFESHHGAPVRQKARCCVGQLLYLDCPPFLTSTVDKMALKAHWKLLPRALGPYRAFSTASKTITIYKDGIPNTILQTGLQMHSLIWSHKTA